jgi:hypothetical protein
LLPILADGSQCRGYTAAWRLPSNQDALSYRWASQPD